MQTARATSPVASRTPGEPSLVVSIHDVSPLTRVPVEEMLSDLSEAGVALTSLLVIPEHHGRERTRIDEDSLFKTWLAKRVSSGHEAVLHGYYHLRPRRPGEGLWTRLITRSYTAGEGEFHDLPHAEAVDLLRHGRAAFGGCGLEPSGFIAPAWLLGSEAEHAVREEGFDYTTRIGSVIDFRGGEVLSARSMVYSVRTRWRRGVSLIWNELLFRALDAGRVPLLRIGLHPPDWRHPAIRRHALESVRRAAAGRRVTTYRDWLDQRRGSGHERCRR